MTDWKVQNVLNQGCRQMHYCALKPGFEMSITETRNDASEAVRSTATHCSGRRFASGCIRRRAFAIFAGAVTSSCAGYPSSLSPASQDTRAAVHQLSREIIEQPGIWNRRASG
jgi:hypothetical protein